MASNFNPGHVTSPHLLQRVTPKVLLRFLRKYKEFLTKENVMPSSADDIDYDGLSVVLASPSEKMPPELLADLVYWDEVSQMASDDDLHDEAIKHKVGYGDKVTKEEIVLLIRMKAPEAIEDLHAIYHAHGQLRKKKRFYSYSTKANKLPKWRKPTARMMEAFSQDMDAWYDDLKKGIGTRVLPIEKHDAIWFIVRHGGTFKKENALENGEPTVVFYRPEDYDLLIYHHRRGELEIYNASNGKRERRAYCIYLGKNLFGNPDFFETNDVPRYTLEPLRVRGRASMDCSAIDGLTSARLTDLMYRFNGTNHHRVSHKAEDVFAGLEEEGLSIPTDAELLCMSVKIKPEEELGGERSVKLYFPNISVYDHESNAGMARQFLIEQEFIRPHGDVNRRD